MQKVELSLQELAILSSCLGNGEGLGPILTFYHPEKAQGMIDRATKLLEADFGTHAIDKQAVASHEAGHGVIAHLVGYRVKNVGVWEDKSRWTGCVEVDYSNLANRGDTWLWSEALVKIAGYIGERLSEKDHPAITVHEKLHCMAISGYFDELHGSTPGHHFTQALTQCQEALEANREVFEEITYRLLATNRVSSTEINTLMEGAVQLPMSLFYEPTQEPNAKGNHGPSIDIHA